MKKLLSIILATAMLISLIPAVFAAGTETTAGIKVVYDFYNADLASLEADVNFQLNNLSYTASNGFWQYADDYDSRGTVKTKGTGFVADSGYIKVTASKEEASTKYWVAFKLNVPKEGKYEVAIEAQTAGYATSIWPTAYIFKAVSDGDIVAKMIPENKMENSEKKFTAKNTYETHVIGSEDFAAGEYYFVFKPSTVGSASYVFLKSLTLTEGDGTQSVPMISSIAETKNADGTTTVEATATKMSNGEAATDVTFSYEVAYDDTDSAEIINGNVVKGLANGTATIIATATKDGLSSSRSIEVKVTAPEPEVPDYTDALTSAFAHESTAENAVTVPAAGVTVNTYVYTVDGTKKNLDDTVTVSAGESYEVDADKITGMDGYEFLYWAKGATMDKKQIVSGNAKYSFIPTVEATHLIAVFAPKTEEGAAKAEFYNGNGQLLPDYTVAGVENVTIPALPSMAGYGDATHWELYGDATEYKEGNTVPLSGSMIFVAQYDELKADININVTGGRCDKTEYKYGDVVTCTPTTTDNFVGWMKDSVIVSMDTEYTFNAWETCTVEAVYGTHEFDGKATKLLIDIFNDKYIMAEFIGLSNYGTVVEKGIMIDNKRFAMQKPLATQFTLEAADAAEAKTAVAYAIFSDGTMITDK